MDILFLHRHGGRVLTTFIFQITVDSWRILPQIVPHLCSEQSCHIRDTSWPTSSVFGTSQPGMEVLSITYRSLVTDETRVSSRWKNLLYCPSLESQRQKKIVLPTYTYVTSEPEFRSKRWLVRWNSGSPRSTGKYMWHPWKDPYKNWCFWNRNDNSLSCIKWMNKTNDGPKQTILHSGYIRPG